MTGRHLWRLTTIPLAALLGAALQGRAAPSASAPPLELLQLKQYLATRSLNDVEAMVKQRGVRFVLTSSIQKELDDSIPSLVKLTDPDRKERNELWDLLRRHQPTELLIGVAPFCGGVRDQAENIQVAMAHKLESLRDVKLPFRIVPLRLDNCLKSDGEADDKGEKTGVHIVVWGEWSRIGNLDTFTPKIRVTAPFGGTAALKSEARPGYSFTYLLEPTEPLRPEITPGPPAATSDLIPLLIGLSFYHRGDYQRASQFLASVSSPSADVFIYLAVCSLGLKQADMANQYLASAERSGHASLEALHDIGTLEYKAGHYDQALLYFDKALVVDPRSYKTLNNKAVVLAVSREKVKEQEDKEEQEHKLGRDTEPCSQEAIATIKSAREFGGPAYPTAVYNHAAILLNCAGYRDTVLEGLKILKEYLDLNPSDHRTWFQCGRVYVVDLSDGEGAEACYLEAIKLLPTSQDYWSELMGNWEHRELNPLSGGANRVAFLQTLLRLLPRARLPLDDQTDYRRTLMSALVLSFAETGRLADARQTFVKVPINSTHYHDCFDRLTYRLANGQIPGGSLDPQSKAAFLAAAYHHYFATYEEGIFKRDKGYLISQYTLVLRQYPSHAPSLLGKALLEYEAADDRAQFIRKEGLATLKKVLRVTTLPATRRDLQECITEMSADIQDR